MLLKDNRECGEQGIKSPIHDGDIDGKQEHNRLGDDEHCKRQRNLSNTLDQLSDSLTEWTTQIFAHDL